jgi:hypothetical protein
LMSSFCAGSSGGGSVCMLLPSWPLPGFEAWAFVPSCRHRQIGTQSQVYVCTASLFQVCGWPQPSRGRCTGRALCCCGNVVAALWVAVRECSSVVLLVAVFLLLSVVTVLAVPGVSSVYVLLPSWPLPGFEAFVPSCHHRQIGTQPWQVCACTTSPLGSGAWVAEG